MKLHFFRAVTVTMFLLLAVLAAFAHGDEKHKGKVTKVTPTASVPAMADSVNGGRQHEDDSMTLHDEDGGAIQKDLEQIIADTRASATNTVIKVVSLALALLGVVVAYYPRKNSISSGNKKKEAEHED